AGNGTIIHQNLANSGFDIDTVIYHITPTANGCNGSVSNYFVRVNPIPNLSNLPLASAQCSNQASNITLNSNVNGTLFTWTATGSTLQVSGFSDNPVPTTLLNQTLLNSGTNVETVTYHLTPHANGCQGLQTDYIVTVAPVPNLSNSPLIKQQCNNLSTNITLTSNVTGTLFTWTATGSSLQVSGYSNNLIPTVTINQLLVNSGFNIDTVTYHITPHANGCDGLLTNFKVIVFPTPELSNNPLFMQVCNNTPTNQTLVSNVAGALFTWTATGSTPQVSGYSDNPVPTSILNQTLVNSGTNVETVTYHMTPHANGCDGILTNYVVTVVSSPDVYFSPPAETICSLQKTAIGILSHVPGTSFSWSATGSSLLVSGFTAGSGDSIKQTLTNSGISQEYVTYTVTPTAWGCPPGNAGNINVYVNPKPSITNSVLTDSICSSTQVIIPLNSSIPGSTFTWLASGSSANVSGYFSGNGNIILQNLTNSGFNNEIVTYKAVPHVNGCSGDTVNFLITVFPVPDVYFSPSSQTICSALSCNISNLSHVTGTSFSWNAFGSTGWIIGYAPGTGSVISQVLFNTGIPIGFVTYSVTPAANGCSGVVSNVVVIVDPAPVVSFMACTDSITTTSGKPFLLKGGNPRGGYYKGTGVDSVLSIFNPALAGPGYHSLSYAYANQFSCRRSDTLYFRVLADPPFTCGNNLTDVRDNQSYPTIQIGSQCWMAANLNYGNEISINQFQRDNCIAEKYVNNASPVTNNAFYQWDEIMQYQDIKGMQGFCPPGWHIPSEAEWNTLFHSYYNYGFAGSPLKYSGYSGFNALLSGSSYFNRGWFFTSFATYFWTSESRSPEKAWAHAMNDLDPSVSWYPSSRSNAFNVRCLRDY
ncbi:MAG: PKD-like domain-containing protein, partial [Bacteroidota bacterium]